MIAAYFCDRSKPTALPFGAKWARMKAAYFCEKSKTIALPFGEKRPF